MKRVRKSAAVRKREIIETAIRIITEEGPERMTTERIAREVGLTQPAIFRHFARKALIWDGIAEYLSDKVFSGMDEILADREKPPLERLRIYMRVHFQRLQEYPYISIFYARLLFGDNESLRHHMQEAYRQLAANMAVLLHEAQQAGQLVDGVELEPAAFLMMGLSPLMVLNWDLNDRRIDLVEEGMKLVETQLRLITRPS